MREQVLLILRPRFGPLCEAEETDGGWIVSIVNADLSRNAQRYDQVLQLLKQGLPDPATGGEVFLIYKLLIYSEEVDQFNMEGALRRRETSYEDGMPTTTTVIGEDAYILLRQLDAEFLMLQGAQNGHVVKLIDANVDLMSLDADNCAYLELEFSGCFFHRFDAQPTGELANGRAIWSLTFQEDVHPGDERF